MTKTPRDINTYKELCDEKQRLEELLTAQRALLRADVYDLKQSFKPASDVLGFVGKLATRKHDMVFINAIANTIINMLVTRGLLKKAGFFTKLLVPFAMKNLSSHIISEELRDKMQEWLRKISSQFFKTTAKMEEDLKDMPEPDMR